MPGHTPKPRSDAPFPGSSWYDVWRTVSVGPEGFWRSQRPREHFRTAVGATGLIARMVLALLASRRDISTVVDIGSGDGRLLADIGALAPGLRLIGLDLRPPLPDDRPSASRLSVEWVPGHWDVRDGTWHRVRNGDTESVPLESVLPTDEPMAIVCAEWLDELPLVVAERGPAGWNQVTVRDDGAESPGAPVPDPDARWLDRWWPAGIGQRAESGRSRDQAWSAVIDCLRSRGGLAVMIDYGHQYACRPAEGTLAGYQQGRPVPARPSTAINLTAHVAVDSVLAAGESAGARTELLISQREAVDRLLPGPGRPEGTDTLTRLQALSERSLLADTLGDHWWLVQSVPEQGV